MLMLEAEENITAFIPIVRDGMFERLSSGHTGVLMAQVENKSEDQTQEIAGGFDILVFDVVPRERS